VGDGGKRREKREKERGEMGEKEAGQEA